tara:strand:+ start:897 stop:1370 length:474 start_codon:yes stop_codon:yes gene_type:complete
MNLPPINAEQQRKLLLQETKGKTMIQHAGTNFELAGDFMEAFGQQVRDIPMWPDFSTRELRLELIREEYQELEEAIDQKDMVAVADALTDLLYVIYGAGHAFGLDLDACYQEVHSSNMSKLDVDGRPLKREDGKVLKGPNFFEPDLSYVLGMSTNGD